MAPRAKQPVKQATQQTGSQSTELDTLLVEYREYVRSFSSVFSTRADEITQMAFAVLMGEHILLKGLPGVAKSMLAMKFLNGFTGGKLFKQQFSSFMDESYLFGPQIIERLKLGEVVHNTENSMVDAEFAFLDEFFNANEETIIACNSILNERVFMRNAQYEESPLISAVLTTNQSREREEKLKPIYDRILFKSMVSPVERQKDRIEMYQRALLGDYVNFKAEFPLSKLKRLRELISEVEVTFDFGVLQGFDNLWNTFQKEANIYLSDRAAIKALNLMRVNAIMRNRDYIGADDLSVLKYTMTTVGDDASSALFDAVFAKIKATLDQEEQVNKFLREVEARFNDYSHEFSTAVGVPKLRALRDELKKFSGEVTIAKAKVKKDPEKSVYVENISKKLTILIEAVLEKLSSMSSDKDIIDDTDWFNGVKTAPGKEGQEEEE